MFNWNPQSLSMDRNKILYFLGYRPEKMKVNPKINNYIDEELARALNLISPKGSFKILSVKLFKNIDMFEDASRVAFAIVTIGDKLESTAKELLNKGEATRAAILDAVGSISVETTASLLNEEIDNLAEGQGYKTTRRFSPGSGDWSVEGQEVIFKHLDKACKELGVFLTSSKIMVPVKSISFVVKLGTSTMKEINKGCDSCNLKYNCPFYRNKHSGKDVETEGVPLCSIHH